MIGEINKYPSGSIAAQLKEHSKASELTKAVIMLLLKGKESESRKVVIKDDKIQEYFPANYDKEKIEEIIFSLLEEWKEKTE